MQVMLRFDEKLLSILGHFFAPFLCPPPLLMLARPNPVSPLSTCCRNLFLIYVGFFTIFASIFVCCQLLIAVRSVGNKDDRLEEEGRQQKRSGNYTRNSGKENIW